MVFITGDRSVDPINAVIVAGIALAALPPDAPVSTGSLGGLEAAVRYLRPDATVYPLNGDVSPQTLDERHERALLDEPQALLIHGDPLGSKIGASAARVWGDALVVLQ